MCDCMINFFFRISTQMAQVIDPHIIGNVAAKMLAVIAIIIKSKQIARQIKKSLNSMGAHKISKILRWIQARNFPPTFAKETLTNVMLATVASIN